MRPPPSGARHFDWTAASERCQALRLDFDWSRHFDWSRETTRSAVPSFPSVSCGAREHLRCSIWNLSGSIFVAEISQNPLIGTADPSRLPAWTADLRRHGLAERR
jgi:hypothetical protein